MKKRWFIPAFAAFMLYSGTEYNIVEAASTEDLSTTAYKYIGKPYLYGGTTTSGFDCSGFTQKVFSDLGININRTSSGQYSQGTAVSKSNLQPGDLIFFNTSGRGVSHVAIYLGNNSFINAETNGGVTVSTLDEPYWANRYIGAKRVAEFSDPKKEVKPASIDLSVYSSRAKVALELAAALKLDTSNPNSTFADIKPTFHYAGAVNAVNQLEIFSGDANNKFNPNSPITRGELAKALVVAFDLKLQQDHIVFFADVQKDHWAYESIMILASNGITVGKGNGNFGVDDLVTIEDMSLFVSKAARKS